MKEIEYDFRRLNHWLNIQDTPAGVIGRVTAIMINYARTTDEDALEDMKDDLKYLSLLMDAFRTIKEKEELI